MRVRHRLGCIGFDVEENHVAEEQLQQACNLLFPGLVDRIVTASGDEYAADADGDAEVSQ